MCTPTKIKQLLLAFSLGDVLGSPHEFNQKLLYTGKIQYRLPKQYKKTTKYLSLGRATDDTEMTLLLAHGLIEDDGYYKDNKQTIRYMEWANSGCRFLGKNTKYLFKGIKTLQTYLKRYNNSFNIDKIDNWTQSNGCMMRCSPLCVLDGNDVLKAVEKDCSITNPHPVNIDCNRIYVLMLWLAIRNFNREYILNYVKYLIQTQDVKDVFLNVFGDKMFENVEDNKYIIMSRNRKRAIWSPNDISGAKKGWCLNALYCCLYCIKNFKTFEDSMKWIITHPNSDTDTNAAITGALLALLGYSLERQLENIKIILTAGQEPELKRPEKLLMNIENLNFLSENLCKLSNPITKEIKNRF